MLKKNKKLIITTVLLILFISFAYLFLKSNPVEMSLSEIFSSQDNLQEYIKGYGALAPIAFIVIQTLQVIAAPIPGNVTALAGGALFGFLQGSLLSTAGLVIGSLIAFTLARIYGRTLVEKFVRKETIDKYIDAMSAKYTIVLFLLFLFPFFPDDALCFIAGLTAINYPFFIILVLVTRPPGMVFSSMVGSGLISPPWWGWAIIVAISASIVYLAFKYGSEIENWLLIRIKKKNDKSV